MMFILLITRQEPGFGPITLQKLEQILETRGGRIPYFMSDKLLGKYLICETFFAEVIFECLETWNVNL